MLILTASDKWREFLSASLKSWGLAVQAFQHPAQISKQALERAAALVIWRSLQTWHIDDESHLAQYAPWIIDGRSDGPGHAFAVGHVVSVCEFGLSGLASALRHSLQGQPLPGKLRNTTALPPCGQPVLVVEDNAPNRALLGEQLRYLGCQPYLVENGVAALQLLEKKCFGALLTDISMPIMDGYELATQVRARWPDMPIIAVTANVALSERERAMAAGVSAVLGKPLLISALAKALSTFSGFGMLKKSIPGGDGVLGDAPVPDALTQAFLQGARESLAVLRQAWLGKDIIAIKTELHHLKGMLGVFRRRDLGHMLSVIEISFEQDPQNFMQQVGYFLDQLEKAIKE